MKEVDCSLILEQVLRSMTATIQESKAVIRCEAMPVVVADAGLLRQLFLNLVSNALKFRKPQVQPQVDIRVRREGGEWLFSVTDNGIGIEDRYFERIFIIFQRLHGQSQVPGTGMGLALCRKIVEKHGGRIWVESTPGEGTTMWFTLRDQESGGQLESTASDG
jgi:light-regulated signal transduction histidine kinase (bacteriophytochrome)